MALAEGLSHPFSLAYALSVGCHAPSFRRERQVAQERAEAVITLSTEQGFPYWLALGTMSAGLGASREDRGEGIAQMRRAWPMRASRAQVSLHSSSSVLAEAYGKAGQVEEGLSVLAEALAFVDKTGERYYEAELYRLKGELTLAKVVKVQVQLSVTPPSPIQSPEQKRKNVFSKPSKSARASRRSHWNFEQ